MDEDLLQYLLKLYNSRVPPASDSPSTLEESLLRSYPMLKDYDTVKPQTNLEKLFEENPGIVLEKYPALGELFMRENYNQKRTPTFKRGWDMYRGNGRKIWM